MLYITLPIFNPNAFQIGQIGIRWYSLAYIFSILICYHLIKFLNKKYQLGFDNDKFYDDLIFYEVLGIVIGGRVGYCFFYNFKWIIKNPLEIFAIWHGGMSFHGGLVGVILATILICKKYKLEWLKLTDLISTVAPIGLFFGRLANFINLELYGRPTKMPWGMIFLTADNLPRHPSQLYEAFFEGIILFIVMLLITKKKEFKTTGLNSFLFLIIYSLFRIFLEFFREPDIQIGLIFNYFTLGQILSIFLIMYYFMILL